MARFRNALAPIDVLRTAEGERSAASSRLMLPRAVCGSQDELEYNCSEGHDMCAWGLASWWLCLCVSNVIMTRGGYSMANTLANMLRQQPLHGK